MGWCADWNYTKRWGSASFCDRKNHAREFRIHFNAPKLKFSRSFRCEGYKSTEYLDHNNRRFIAKNVDKNRISDNITYIQQDIREKYNELFGKALEEYNAGKKKTRDKIPDYY